MFLTAEPVAAASGLFALDVAFLRTHEQGERTSHMQWGLDRFEGQPSRYEQIKMHFRTNITSGAKQALPQLFNELRSPFRPRLALNLECLTSLSRRKTSSSVVMDTPNPDRPVCVCACVCVCVCVCGRFNSSAVL